MPTVTLAPGDYWRLRYRQEQVEHAKTKALLLQLRATAAHEADWAALVRQQPALATSDHWTFTDATLTLTADAPGDA